MICLYRYRTKKGVFETNNFDEIPLYELHSLNDNPAYEDLSNGFKIWSFEGKTHRKTGPAVIWPNGIYSFWLYGLSYNNVNDWLKDHPNKDEEFQKEMREKYSK